MSKEMQAVDTTKAAANVYFQVFNSRNSQFWNTSTVAFQTYASANIANYGIAGAKAGTSDFWTANFPTGVTTNGEFGFIARIKAGGSFAESDVVVAVGTVKWDGANTQAMIVTCDSNSYQVGSTGSFFDGATTGSVSLDPNFGNSLIVSLNLGAGNAFAFVGGKLSVSAGYWNDSTNNYPIQIGPGHAGQNTAYVNVAKYDSGVDPAVQYGTAAAGGASTITIATALGADSLPVGFMVKITGGTGVGQCRVITAYVNSTKVVTVDRPWITNPDATSVYAILYGDAPAISVGLKITETALVTGLTASNLDAAVSSRMATYAQPAGFLTVTFVAGIVASTTNITAGTMTTTTNLTNAPPDSSGTTTLLGRMTAARAGYFDNLNIGGNVASHADIAALNQSASKHLLLVTVGQFEPGETYTVEMRTFAAADGSAVNADTTPTLTATGNVSGSLSANLSVASNPATGLYRWTYTPGATPTLEQIRFDGSATISSATFTLSAYSQTVDFATAVFTATDQSHLTSIFNKLPTNNIADETLVLSATAIIQSQTNKLTFTGNSVQANTVLFSGESVQLDSGNLPKVNAASLDALPIDGLGNHMIVVNGFNDGATTVGLATANGNLSVDVISVGGNSTGIHNGIFDTNTVSWLNQSVTINGTSHLPNVQAAAVTNGAISSASFTIAAIAGVATGILEMIVQLFRGEFKKKVYDRNAQTIKTYADDGTTVLTTQSATSSGGVDTQGPAS